MLPWRLSATAIIMSKSTGRVLIMKRGPNAKFMPNAYVFPGGIVDENDENLGPSTRICALREVFEETGLLVGEHGIKSAADDLNLAELQDIVKKNPKAFNQILFKQAVEQLVPLSTWLTPQAYPKRFLTDFYLLPVEGEPRIRMCEHEMVQYAWETPNECLGKKQGLPPPQVYKLLILSQVGIDELKATGPTSRVIAPQKVSSLDGINVAMVLPGDHLYIEENCEFVPLRQLDLKDLSPDFSKPTHRVQYTDLWKNPEVYQHYLQEPYLSIFRPIQCHSRSKL